METIYNSLFHELLELKCCSNFGVGNVIVAVLFREELSVNIRALSRS